MGGARKLLLRPAPGPRATRDRFGGRVSGDEARSRPRSYDRPEEREQGERWNGQEEAGSRGRPRGLEGLRRVPDGPQGPHPPGPDEGRAVGEPGADPPLLADRERPLGPPAEPGLGGQG